MLVGVATRHYARSLEPLPATSSSLYTASSRLNLTMPVDIGWTTSTFSGIGKSRTDCCPPRLSDDAITH